MNVKATLRTLLCPCNCVSRCTKLLRLCRIMWTICCLSRILHNPLVLHVMTCGPSTMRVPIKEKFYCLCKPVFLHSGESTLCFRIPALQQHHIAPTSIILERYPNWPISLDNCCGSLQVVHGGHLIGPVADQVSLCDHQIGQRGIRYPRSLGHQMGHTSFVVFLLSL